MVQLSTTYVRSSCSFLWILEWMVHKLHQHWVYHCTQCVVTSGMPVSIITTQKWNYAAIWSYTHLQLFFSNLKILLCRLVSQVKVTEWATKLPTETSLIVLIIPEYSHNLPRYKYKNDIKFTSHSIIQNYDSSFNLTVWRSVPRPIHKNTIYILNRSSTCVAPQSAVSQLTQIQLNTRRA